MNDFRLQTVKFQFMSVKIFPLTTTQNLFYTSKIVCFGKKLSLSSRPSDMFQVILRKMYYLLNSFRRLLGWFCLLLWQAKMRTLTRTEVLSLVRYLMKGGGEELWEGEGDTEKGWERKGRGRGESCAMRAGPSFSSHIYFSLKYDYHSYTLL